MCLHCFSLPTSPHPSCPRDPTCPATSTHSHFCIPCIALLLPLMQLPIPCLPLPTPLSTCCGGGGGCTAPSTPAHGSPCCNSSFQLTAVTQVVCVIVVLACHEVLVPCAQLWVSRRVLSCAHWHLFERMAKSASSPHASVSENQNQYSSAKRGQSQPINSAPMLSLKTTARRQKGRLKTQLLENRASLLGHKLKQAHQLQLPDFTHAGTQQIHVFDLCDRQYLSCRRTWVFQAHAQDFQRGLKCIKLARLLQYKPKCAAVQGGPLSGATGACVKTVL